MPARDQRTVGVVMVVMVIVVAMPVAVNEPVVSVQVGVPLPVV